MKTVFAKFEVLISALPRMRVFWDLTLCCWVSGSRFVSSKCLLQVKGVQKEYLTPKQTNASLRNVGSYSPSETASHPTFLEFSQPSPCHKIPRLENTVNTKDCSKTYRKALRKKRHRHLVHGLHFGYSGFSRFSSGPPYTFRNASIRQDRFLPRDTQFVSNKPSDNSTLHRKSLKELLKKPSV